MRHLKPKKRKWLKATGITLASMLVLGGAAGGYTYWDMNQRLKANAVDIGTGDNLKPAAVAVVPEVSPQIGDFQGAFTVLLLGNDSGQGSAQYGSRDHGLSDVNILLHVSADHTKATAISIPRDTLVDVPECTDPQNGTVYPAISGIKINEALERGGMKCTVDTVRQLTGETIQYAAMIQFQGVVALSNVVGGVPVCLTSAINDPLSGLNLPAGESTISGDQALAFLRTRHGVGDGSDLARISNQQSFLSSLMRKLKSSNTLSDPTKVMGIANAVASNMTLSSNLASVNTLASLAYSLKSISLSNITFIQYPTTYTTTPDGASAVLPNQQDASAMLDAVFSDKGVALSGGTAPGSIGAIAESPAPTDSSSATASPAPTNSLATPEVTSAAPNATAAPTPSDAPASPSQAPTATSVTLPTDVTGMTAAQTTCSRGYGNY